MRDFLFVSFLQPAPQPKAKKAEKKKRKRTKKGKNSEIVYHLENNQHWRPCALCWLSLFVKNGFCIYSAFMWKLDFLHDCCAINAHYGKYILSAESFELMK